jgi:phosphoribosylamine--glycine ligase
MKVLIIGSGGREHALSWKIAQSPHVKKLYCAPGNGGIETIAQCVPIKAMDIEGVVSFSKSEGIDLVVVAPDDPLAAGMVDALEKEGIRAFGPCKDAAIIESSKAFSKNLMKKYGIPTAAFEVFDNKEAAIEYLKKCSFPIVVKADGLALGKGVIIAKSYEEAEDAVNSMMSDKLFGCAGDKIVIEEFLEGQEVTVLAFADGKTVVPMVSAQDHKRAFDNDEGLNTGGMGAFSPSRLYTDELQSYCLEKIYLPTLEAMRRENRKFKGVLYFGLILTDDGPKVLEYNARFGDPETQVILPRLETDIIDIFNAVIDEKLGSPKYPLDERDIAQIAGIAWDRDHDPLSIMRQAAAVIKSGDRTKQLHSIQIPTLVIHGEDDKMIDISGGRATAAAIPNAELVTFKGMGHNLPKQLWSEFAKRIANLIHRTEYLK